MFLTKEELIKVMDDLNERLNDQLQQNGFVFVNEFFGCNVKIYSDETVYF